MSLEKKDNEKEWSTSVTQEQMESMTENEQSPEFDVIGTALNEI